MIEEFDLFSFSSPKFVIDKPIRLIELFAGIGSQYAALKRLGLDVTPWKVVEIDKYACASYSAIHGVKVEPTDIKEIHAKDLEIVDRDKYLYILTYSFPCQDISCAGLGRGLDKGLGTRSGLLWEVERILDECNENLPQCLLLENVPLLVGKKHIHNFKKWRSKLESLGYSNYVQLLNAKDYGIPQNRNRCFMVSLLGDYHYSFPKKRKLELRLKDMLEEKVDEKYYLSDAMVKYFVANTEEQKAKGNGFRFEPFERERERVAKSIVSKEGNNMQDNFVKDSLNTEQENVNPIKSSPQTESQEHSNQNLSRKTHSKSLKRSVPELDKQVSNTVRGGGRNSLDRHQWDLIKE